MTPVSWICVAVYAILAAVCWYKNRELRAANERLLEHNNHLTSELVMARERGDHFYNRFVFMRDYVGFEELPDLTEVPIVANSNKTKRNVRILRVKPSEKLSTEETDDILFKIMCDKPSTQQKE